MCLTLLIKHTTGWYLWPVKGSLNNQCDLVEVLLVSIQLKCAALCATFLFLFFGLFLIIFSIFSFV